MSDDERDRQGNVLKTAFSYQDGLLTYAYGMLRDWALAEDAVQDTYVVVMKKWSDFQEGSSMFAWLKAIARRKALELMRARHRESTDDDALLCQLIEQAMDEFLDERAAQRQNDTMRRLHHCLGKITQRSLELVLERYSMRRSYEELAALFSMNIEAVRKSLYRIRRTLQECIEGLSEPEIDMAVE